MKKKKSIFILLISFLAIGFATVSTSLIINGITSIGVNSNDFDVYFSSANLDENSRNDLISANGKTINFSSKILKNKDDVSILNYEITNDSRQYDAELSVECDNAEDEIYSIVNELSSNIIRAGETKSGILSVTLNKEITEDMNVDFKCNLIVNAKSRTEEGSPAIDANNYLLAGYLVDENNEILANKSIVIYSNTPHYVTSDNEGYVYLSRLERGTHELYYFNNTPISELGGKNKSEIKELANGIAEITTNALSVEFNNNVRITDLYLGAKDDFKVLTIHMDDEIMTRIVDDQHKNFNIIKNSEWDSIRVNNGTLINYDNNILSVEEMLGSSDVYFSNSVISNVNSSDASENHVYLLKDVILTKSFNTLVNKDVTFDFMGHTLTYPTSACTKVNDSAYYNLISVQSNSRLFLKNGTILNNDESSCGLSDVSGSFETNNMTIKMKTINSSIWVRKNSEVSINNTIFENMSTSGAIADIHTGDNDNLSGHIVVKNSRLKSNGITIRLTHAGIVDVEDSEVAPLNTGTAIRSTGKGEINIKGNQVTLGENDEYLSGTYIHSDKVGQLINVSGGTMNVYNGTLRHLFNGSPVGACAIYLGGGNLNIYDGELYSYRDFALYEANASSVIRIFGGHLKSHQYTVIAHDRGNMYISNGVFESVTSNAISNYTGNLYISGGTFKGNRYSIASPGYQDKIGSNSYICGGSFESPKDINITDSTAHVYYKDSLSWKNGTTPSVFGTTANAIKDNAITCPVGP